MVFKPAPLFYVMAKIVSDNYFAATDKRCIRIRNEGGSRSSKTYCFFYLLEWLCSNNPNAGWHIYIYRDTLTNCRDFTLKDFQDCKRIMGTYNPDLLKGYGQKPEYNLYGNMVYFRGLEDDVEYPPCQIAFFNEAMEVTEASYKAASKRCSMLDVADWNPKFTDHWIFKHEGQPHTWFTHSTYRDNPYCDPALVAKYESWCPWEFDDLHLPEGQRRPNAANTKAGTIDRTQWLIYGEGIRCAMEGVIFGGKEIPVTYVDAPPAVYSQRWFGLDFGNTTGTWAFAEARKTDETIVYDCPIYASFLNAEDFYDHFRPYYQQQADEWATQHEGVPMPQWVIVCDVANPQFIADLNRLSIKGGTNTRFVPCKKFDGCVEWRIGLMAKNGVTLVNRKHIRREQENYFWDSVRGIPLQKAKKNGFDHFFDAAGMAIQYETSLR
jgi:hypothetical protein